MSHYRERALKLFQQSRFYNETWNDRWIVECIFPGKRNGYFLEAGAAGGIYGSSCYVLESRLGWTGICVEPNSTFFQQLVKNRLQSVCENVCLSTRNGQVAFVEGGKDSANSYLSGIKSHLERFKHGSENIIQQGTTVMKQAIALEVLLSKHNAPSIIDYAAFDIEGSEFEVLKEFPFNKNQFLALSLECDGLIWKPITHLLTANGYREVSNPFNLDKNWERYWLHQSMS
jgi:FkbM family methyltransferase